MFRDRQGRMREREERQSERDGGKTGGGRGERENVSHLEDPRKDKIKIGGR